MKKHIMFVSLPLRGHANHMIALAEELVFRGHQVSFVTSVSAKEWLANTSVNFIPWELRIKDNEENINKESFWKKVSQKPNLHGERIMSTTFINMYFYMYKTLEPIFYKYTPDLLVIDCAVIPAMYLAQQLNLPYIVQSIFLGKFVKNSSKSPRFGTSYSINMNFWQRWLNFFSPLLLLPLFLVIVIKLNQARLQCVTSKKTNNPLNPFKNHLMIVGTSFGIEIPRPLPPLVQMVGPILPKTFTPLSSSLNKWLEECQEVTSVIYIAFGSLVVLESWQAKELVEGLTDMKFRVLWSLPKSQQHILPLLPPSFRIEPFVSQQAVLSHPAVCTFISHCGINSINEALYWGKPILALPFFGDQPYNAARIVDLGAGLKLNKEHFNSAEVSFKINTLLSVQKYKEAACRMSVVLRKAKGLDKAADLVETTLAVGISHLTR